LLYTQHFIPLYAPQLSTLQEDTKIFIRMLLACFSLCNTQARAVNMIPAILCDDEGVTQARGC